MPFEVTVRGQRPWPAISLRPEPRGDSLADIFRDIAGSGDWGQGESESGFGSDLVQTAALRDALPKLVAALDVRRFLDIPCGDMFWMSQCRLGVEHYLGADVVPEIVARARSRFGADGRQLQVLDLLHDPLPRVDMVFSRDCLVHLDDNDIMAALRNVVRSQATYFAATTFVRREVNLPGTTGGWRTLNLCRAPFQPARTIGPDQRTVQRDLRPRYRRARQPVSGHTRRRAGEPQGGRADVHRQIHRSVADCGLAMELASAVTTVSRTACADEEP
jgi:hypothetical protein